MKIGIIGTGLLGYSIALRLAQSDNQIFAYNRSIEKAKPLEKHGVTVLASPEEVFTECEYILAVLSDYHAYLESFSTISHFENKIFIQMGTLSPIENKALEQLFISKNISFLESPVLGSKKEAKSGKLLIMASGDKDIYNQCQNVLKIISESISYIGEIGKASTLKLALNQFIASLTASFSLSLGMIQKSDIDTDIFMDILRKSALYAPTFDKKLDNMLNNNFENPNFPTKHLLKDVNLIKDTAESLDLDTRALYGVRSIIEKAIDMNLAEKDYSAIFNAVVNQKN